MAKSVIFDIEVIGRIDEIAGYIGEAFGETAAKKFVRTVFKNALRLADFPEMGIQSQKFPTLRYLRVTKYNRLYYRIDGNEILIIFLFDLRQDPARDPYQ